MWNVIHRDGLEQCTVRNVAKEAGLSAGSMRHYFPHQSELFIYSMRLVANRVKTRIENMTFNGTPAENVKQLLFQLMPLDEERKLEMEAWYAFTAKSLSDPELKPLRKEMNEGIYSACKSAVEMLVKPKKTGIDVLKETEHLYALVDGLALHLIMAPERLTAERIDTVLAGYLRSLE